MRMRLNRVMHRRPAAWSSSCDLVQPANASSERLVGTQACHRLALRAHALLADTRWNASRYSTSARLLSSSGNIGSRHSARSASPKSPEVYLTQGERDSDLAA